MKGLYTFIERNFAVVNIIFYEFFGTLFFSYGVVTGLNGNFAYNSFFEGVFSSVWIPLCLFMMICYAGRFTRAHFNPAVTFAFMLKKKDRVSVLKGFAYFVA
jgi:glycerol uptake facilitator-like aquaporin